MPEDRDGFTETADRDADEIPDPLSPRPASRAVRSLQANTAWDSAMPAPVSEEDGEMLGNLSTEYDSYSSCLLLNVQSLNPSARSKCSWKMPYLEDIIKQKSQTNCTY